MCGVIFSNYHQKGFAIVIRYVPPHFNYQSYQRTIHMKAANPIMINSLYFFSTYICWHNSSIQDNGAINIHRPSWKLYLDDYNNDDLIWYLTTKKIRILITYLHMLFHITFIVSRITFYLEQWNDDLIFAVADRVTKKCRENYMSYIYCQCQLILIYST